MGLFDGWMDMVCVVLVQPSLSHLVFNVGRTRENYIFEKMPNEP